MDPGGQPNSEHAEQTPVRNIHISLMPKSLPSRSCPISLTNKLCRMKFLTNRTTASSIGLIAACLNIGLAPRKWSRKRGNHPKRRPYNSTAG